MSLQRRVLVCALAVGMSGAVALPAMAAPWVRGYVVGTYEYAFHYGGRAGYARGADIEPGVDCPHGNTIFFAGATQTRTAISRQPWRSKEEIDNIVDPPGLDQIRDASTARITIWNRAIAYRGYKKGIETYVNPFAADDPGMPEVTGRIGDGFNLDGKVKATDFVSPDGEKGIDNALYRAWGCDAPWRGNGNATLDLRANDKMQDGLYTVVIRVSGNQDPMNDTDATVEIGYSPDKIVRDAQGGVAADYSYRILKAAQYTKLKAKIKNGVVETEQVSELHMPRLSWAYSQTGDADVHQGRIRLTMAPDGVTAAALIGGYRNWRDLFSEHAYVQDAGGQGIREHEDHVSDYYALRRNADAMPDPKTGQNMGISMAYRMKLSAAIIEDPFKPMDMPIAKEERSRYVQKAFHDALVKSLTTLRPQNVPPGIGEAAFPAMERAIAELPSKEYFFKTLDRPYFPAGTTDNQGNQIDAQGQLVKK
jgi:hypothetical protein